MTVRRALWAAGLRYRLHDKTLPGRPNIVFPSKRIIVLVTAVAATVAKAVRGIALPKVRLNSRR